MRITVAQLVGIIILIIVIAAIAFLGADKFNYSGSKKVREAVFLTNGQVYFGYVAGKRGDYLVLRDIYYLQVQQSLQPPKDQQNQQPQISLVKLGNELHGPEDEMLISDQQILFRERMKKESKVNDAITEYIKNGGKTAATPTPAP